jgi:hypothetical protein
MTVLRAFADQDYQPVYSTFIIRDVTGPARARPRVNELLAEYAVDTQPSGTFARAGDGWIEAVAAADDHAVRIELHDGPPAGDDLSGWAEVIETPFATSGMIQLALVVGAPIGQEIELGAPGLYRLQFAVRPLEAGNDPRGWPCEYRLRFWATDAPPDPPRWLRRHGSPVDGQAPSEGGVFDGVYGNAVTDIVMLALWAAECDTPVTLAWLAERLFTTTTTIRAVLKHPSAETALSIHGDLDEDDAPLALTVLARKPRETRVRTTSTPAPPALPATRARPAIPGRRTTRAHRRGR